ncbi:unnamed protein product [Tilletia laevis]|uniref:Ndc10 domain-containing protein n=2 Tax=Tilletia TaxID=13289 RepID=A0A9N8M7Y0_9BASI|nr:hypothetical protein CF336_g7528 [Tilletia laevis]CAD6940952.1 unnamed protein product [Tilletia caries]CAD6951171.1 unnamed protein product [Tilletia laevis]CAD6963443.1 unnamed protein product [Tilletia laevis]
MSSASPFPDLTYNRTWYDIHLLRDKDGASEPISYDTYKNPVTKAFKALGLTGCKKVTHAARGLGAREAELLEVSSAEIERLGGWKASDAMTQYYLTHLPIRAPRAMSGFNPNGGTYFLARDTLEPPLALQKQIFSQIEHWQARVDNKKISTSGGAEKFLSILCLLRRVILQDAPGLHAINRAHPVLQDPFFRSTSFAACAKQQKVYLDQHQQPAELSLQQVVPTISDKLKKIAQQQSVIQQQLSSIQEEKSATEESSRRRDEAIMFEVQRHNATILKLQAAPASAFMSSSTPNTTSDIQAPNSSLAVVPSHLLPSSHSALLPPPPFTSTSNPFRSAAAAAMEYDAAAVNLAESTTYELGTPVNTVRLSPELTRSWGFADSVLLRRRAPPEAERGAHF